MRCRAPAGRRDRHLARRRPGGERRTARLLRPLAHEPPQRADARALPVRVPPLPRPLPVGAGSTRRGTRPTTAASRPATARASSPPTTARCAASARAAGSSPPRSSTRRTWSAGCGPSAGPRTRSPRYWGLHNYVDANRRRTRGTRRLLRAVKGLVWFTETGGIVARHNPHRITFPESAHHAAVATRFVFRRLVAAQQARRPASTSTSGTRGRRRRRGTPGSIGPTGRTRPAYRVVARALRAQTAREAAHRDGRHAPTPR